MKLLTLVATLAAFSTPAFADVVSSKEPGKAHCTRNEPDESLVKSDAVKSASQPAVESVAK